MLLGLGSHVSSVLVKIFMVSLPIQIHSVFQAVHRIGRVASPTCYAPTDGAYPCSAIGRRKGWLRGSVRISLRLVKYIAHHLATKQRSSRNRGRVVRSGEAVGGEVVLQLSLTESAESLLSTKNDGHTVHLCLVLVTPQFFFSSRLLAL